MSRIAVIDFETTGLSPGMGDRATEAAIVLVEGGQVGDRFQSLMNAGMCIPAFITTLTGITNAMVAAAPAADQVMRNANRFVGNAPPWSRTTPRSTVGSGKLNWFAQAKQQCNPLLAPCWLPEGFTRRRPATSLKCWLTTISCPKQAVPTGPWLMLKWLRRCWGRFSMICACDIALQGQIMVC